MGISGLFLLHGFFSGKSISMQESLPVNVVIAIEERVVLPIRLCQRPRDYFASACLLAFIACFWGLVLSLGYFVQAHHLK